MDNHVGFTGTRNGMTMVQMDNLTGILLAQKKRDVDNWFHHGDCIGSDEQAHKIAKDLGYKVHLHPPSDDKQQAFCQEYDAITEPKSYRARNRDIIRTCGVLVATPAEDQVMVSSGMFNFRGSGTWMTVHMAQELDKPRIICYPDGLVWYSERP